MANIMRTLICSKFEGCEDRSVRFRVPKQLKGSARSYVTLARENRKGGAPNDA
jgi:hypothetical protein